MFRVPKGLYSSGWKSQSWVGPRSLACLPKKMLHMNRLLPYGCLEKRHFSRSRWGLVSIYTFTHPSIQESSMYGWKKGLFVCQRWKLWRWVTPDKMDKVDGSYYLRMHVFTFYQKLAECFQLGYVNLNSLPISSTNYLRNKSGRRIKSHTTCTPLSSYIRQIERSWMHSVRRNLVQSHLYNSEKEEKEKEKRRKLLESPSSIDKCVPIRT